jgi:hypothetical protein
VAERGWNYTHMLFDITCEEVDIRTHGIVHLEHHVESQDVELEERADTIIDLEQQLLELQGHAPLEHVDHEESMPCLTLMRTKSHRCRMRGVKF